ncbi:serine/threonine-protein kinase SBK1-like [Rhineura floridana]|uniref:serine/threonine-protein kinase SBK1-like n=1 Tax=Rhineura floridana TaxID=261503 RepID=UPI002AC862BC|nr:serine/threonine-protein kinase SBK1-like [Rhineura floridana]
MELERLEPASSHRLSTEKNLTVLQLSAHPVYTSWARVETAEPASGTMTPGQTDATVQEKQATTRDWSTVVFPQKSSVTAPAQKCFPDQGSIREQETSSTANLEDTEDNEEFLEQLMSITSHSLPQMEVEEKYSIAKELGSGSYGHVLQVQHRERGTSMALKLMSKERTGRREFLREYCIALCLSSHHILLRTTGIAFETSTHYGFAQELAPAGDLCAILESGEGLPEIQVKRCAAQLADALDFMHGKALVHRDIKLDNVLLFDKECRQVKLGDFGLTRVEGTQVAAMSGTLPYSPPELCLLEGTETLALDTSLDVWAFGVLLFCLCTGCFPWDVAMSPDPQFDEFGIWQNRTVPGEAPCLWKGLTTHTLDMFRRLMAIDPNRRSPAIEVHKYLLLPWRVDSCGETQSPKDDPPKAVDSDAFLSGPTGDNTDLGSSSKENCPGQIQPELTVSEKTHTIQNGHSPGSKPNPQEDLWLTEPGLQP